LHPRPCSNIWHIHSNMIYLESAHVRLYGRILLAIMLGKQLDGILCCFMFTNTCGWRLDVELISVHGLTISNHAQCDVPQNLSLVRSTVTRFSTMWPGGSNCKYPFLLPFYDEISLCTRPSSLSFCDEKYPGCPFYAWTPWLLFFVFDVSSFKHADASTQDPNIRSSSNTQLSFTTTTAAWYFLVSRAATISSWLWSKQ